MAPRDELFSGGEYTVYTMWDGHALFGPGRPGVLEKAAVLSAVLPVQEFLSRYASLGETCEVWAGEEILGIGCDPMCAHLAEVCPDDPNWVCDKDCAELPREIVECLAASDTCAADAGCGLAEWFGVKKVKTSSDGSG